jgi:bacterioferritin
MAKAVSDKDKRRLKSLRSKQGRAMELYAITQYMNQHYGLDSMDYGEQAKNRSSSPSTKCATRAVRRTQQGTWRRTGHGIHGQGGQGQDVRAISRSIPSWKTTPSTPTTSFCRSVGTWATTSRSALRGHHRRGTGPLQPLRQRGRHIANLGDVYLSKIAGTPASTGARPRALSWPPAKAPDPHPGLPPRTPPGGILPPGPLAPPVFPWRGAPGKTGRSQVVRRK